jgi:hypothetical protein
LRAPSLCLENVITKVDLRQDGRPHQPRIRPAGDRIAPLLGAHGGEFLLPGAQLQHALRAGELPQPPQRLLIVADRP